jgi:hypothetical protein
MKPRRQQRQGQEQRGAGVAASRAPRCCAVLLLAAAGLLLALLASPQRPLALQQREHNHPADAVCQLVEAPAWWQMRCGLVRGAEGPPHAGQQAPPPPQGQQQRAADSSDATPHQSSSSSTSDSNGSSGEEGGGGRYIIRFRGYSLAAVLRQRLLKVRRRRSGAVESRTDCMLWLYACGARMV